MLLLRAGDTLTQKTAHKLEEVFTVDDKPARCRPSGRSRNSSGRCCARAQEDVAAAKAELEKLVKAAARPEANRLYRTVCRWWKEIEVLIITGATTGKVEANNTAVKNIKRTARGYRNPANYRSVVLLRSAARTAT